MYEDALTILSYASPYDVELEVESGGGATGSRPTTLLKKTVGPSPSRICHPLYRSQSIPELSQSHKTSAKRLFIADPNESLGSNYSTMNSTIKSSKSTPGSHTLERHHEEAKAQNNHHHKFGIKVLPALDGTVHRIENQNEHNTNLERRNSRKLDMENDAIDDTDANARKSRNPKKIEHLDNLVTERHQKRENPRQREVATNKLPVNDVATFDHEISETPSTKETTDLSFGTNKSSGTIEPNDIPTEVPVEVHNAAMAARRNRKNSMEMLLNAAKTTSSDNSESNDLKSPHKNKRKAPAPPVVAAIDSETKAIVSDKRNDLVASSKKIERENPDDSIESITDYVESLNDYVGKIRDGSVDTDSLIRRQILDENSSNRHKTETDSDNDSEIHDSFTTIELKPADITIHHTPLPSAQGQPNGDDVDEDDDVYRKAASLGDLSKYENKSLATLERAQSLDMADTGSKKRKLVTPDDIHESSEDLTKIEEMNTFDRRKLKKSNEWGTLEDAIWKKPEVDDSEPKTRTRKRSNGTLERSRSAVEMKLKNDESTKETEDPSGRLVPIEMPDDTSIELYNLPVSIPVTKKFVHTERMFNPDEDNSLALIVNNGRVVKSPTPEQIESDFRRKTPVMSDDDDHDDELGVEEVLATKNEFLGLAANPRDDEFGAALRYFDREISRSSMNDENPSNSFKNLDFTNKEKNLSSIDGSEDIENSLYAGKHEAEEEPMRKVTVVTGCPGCDRKHSHHDLNCTSSRYRVASNGDTRHNRDALDWKPQEVSKLPESPTEDDESSSMSAFKIGITRFEKNAGEIRLKSVSPTESRIEKKLLRERGIELDDVCQTGNDTKHEPTIDLTDFVADEDEEGYDFGSNITVNSKTMSSPILDRHNVSNVSVSSGENSEDSGLVGESGDYGGQDFESRPPLPNTPVPSSASPQKLTYITEINLSTSRENCPESQPDRADYSTKKETGKPPRNEASLTANGKATPGKKPPVPPRRNDASKIQSKDSENTDKQVVFVSEYKSTAAKGRNENTDKNSTSYQTETPKKGASKKFENWIYLGDNKEQNPWGNGSSQQQPITNIVVSATDEKNNLHQ